MTIRDVYIGELGDDGALDWGGEPRTGNIPKRIGPFFSAYGAAWHPHDTLIHLIGCGVLKGQKVDWGAFAATVSVPELKLFAQICYGPCVPDEVTGFIAALDATRRYALVASEL